METLELSSSASAIMCLLELQSEYYVTADAPRLQLCNETMPMLSLDWLRLAELHAATSPNMQLGSAMTPACLHETGPVLQHVQHLKKLSTQTKIASQKQPHQD